MKYASILLVTLFVGCAHSPSPADSLKAKAEALLIQDSDPYVYTELDAPENKRAFRTVVCKLPDDRSKWSKSEADECDKKAHEQWQARMSERYFACNGDMRASIVTWCNAHMVECDDDKVFEDKVRECHNAGIQARYDHALRNRQRALAVERAERNASFGAFLQGFHEGSHPPDATIEVRQR